MHKAFERIFFVVLPIEVRMRADTSTSQTLSLWMNKQKWKKGSNQFGKHIRKDQVPFGIFAENNNVFVMSIGEIERNIVMAERAIFIHVVVEWKPNATCCAKARWNRKTNTIVVLLIRKDHQFLWQQLIQIHFLETMSKKTYYFQDFSLKKNRNINFPRIYWHSEPKIS